MTVSEFFATRFEHLEGRVAPSTQFTRHGIFRNRIEPELGAIRLDRLTPVTIERCLTRELRAGHKASTVDRTFSLLRMALNAAVQWGFIASNVAKKVRPPRLNEPEWETWSAEEQRAFHDANGGAPLYWLFRLVMETGLRRGEVLALRWANVDLEQGGVHVRETMSRDEDGRWMVRDRPKTANGMRPILIAPSTLDGLRKHRTAQLQRRLALGAAWRQTDLVFDRGDGARLDPEALRRAFAEATVRAGLRKIRFHDLRHSSATLLMAHNVHHRIGEARRGHKDAKSMKRYLHPALEMQRPVVELFEELVYEPAADTEEEAV
jgi:integrase